MVRVASVSGSDFYLASQLDALAHWRQAVASSRVPTAYSNFEFMNNSDLLVEWEDKAQSQMNSKHNSLLSWA